MREPVLTEDGRSRGAHAGGQTLCWTCPGFVDTWVMPPGAADATGARRPAD